MQKQSRFARSWRFGVILAGFIAIAALAGGQGTPPSTTELSPELKKLDFLAGSWKTQGQSKLTAYSRDAALSSETSCAWAPNHGYLVCDQMVQRPDGKHNSLSVYTYDVGAKAYKYYGLDRDGGPRSVAIFFEGNVLTYPGEFDDNGKKIKMRTLNEVISTDSYTYRTEFSDDDGNTWTLMNEGKSTRVSAKK